MAVPYKAAPAMTPVAIPTEEALTELEPLSSPETAFACVASVSEEADPEPVPELEESPLVELESDPVKGHVLSIIEKRVFAEGFSCW